MKKFKDFFVKHKKIFIITSIIVLLAAVSLTAVTIALWNEDEEHTEIVNEPVNPAVKYLEYYVVVENASSECGFDYYPTTRVPKEMYDRIIGLAVARYDGFASHVEIPQNATVTLKVDNNTFEDTYPVRPEVALLIQQNPNILEEIEEKYNVEELELRRLTLITSGMYGFGEEDDGEVILENIKTKLDEEIATQKTERSEYLQSIIRAGLVESQTKAK